MVRRILVADDDDRLATMVSCFLAQRGYDVEVASDGATALARLGTFSPDVLITDVQMPALDGFTLLRQAHASYPDCAVVVMTGYGSVDDAGRAKQYGALHYLQKPFPPDDLVNILERLEQGAKASATQSEQFPEIIGESRAMREVFSKILQVANLDMSVLIQGETGTGKDLVAMAVHRLSFRSRGRFVVVNCAELNTDLFESELFGHVKGSFTGADRNKEGLLLAADGGTLFLDEVGELDKRNQAKLLRALESGEVRRVGDTKSQKTDVRFVAATNMPLRRASAEGSFRSDLFFRLAAFSIELPPLRERREDIPLLAKAFLKRIAADRSKPMLELSVSGLDKLYQHRWQGNVRELRNALALAEVNATNKRHPRIEADDIILPDLSLNISIDPMAHPGYKPEGASRLFQPILHAGAPGPAAAGPFVQGEDSETWPLTPLPKIDFDSGDLPSYRDLRGELLRRFDRAYFSRLLERTHGNVSKASRLAGLDRKRLRGKIEEAGMKFDDFR